MIPPLWKHQEEAIRQAEGLPGYGLFFEPGTGKTRTVIELLKRKANAEKRLPRTLIFAPPIVLDNWRNEWFKYTAIERGRVTMLSGPGRKRHEVFEEKAWRRSATVRAVDTAAKTVTLGANKPEIASHIFVTNYESLSMEPLFDAMMEWQPEVLIFDECHRLANPKSKRSKLAEQLARKTTPRPLVYMLSGTPVMNSMMDIFQQFKIMDGGATFGDNFFVFRSKYFRDKNAGMNKHNYFPNWVPLPTTAQELSEKMKARSMCVKKEECLDLPPVVEQVISVQMDPEQKRIYDQMFKDYVAFFERDGEQHAVMANMAMIKGLRLMQIASGFVKTDAGIEMPATNQWTPKQDALLELLENLKGRKVILWAVFTYNYKQIRDVLTTLGAKWVELNGEQGAKKNRENAALFESDPSIQYAIAHPESAGEGINLVSAAEMVSFSRDLSLRRWEQLIARNYRGGSEVHDKITRYILTCEGTVEDKVSRGLMAKKEMSLATLKEITFSLK